MDLSGGIRFHRQRHGLTQQELADLAGLDPALIARYEAGEQQPNIPDAGAIAAVLQVGMVRLAEPVAEGEAPAPGR